jgi:hypothetical protein
MGMYDTIKINHNKLPVENKEFFKDIEFQTKDLENAMEYYFIMDDNTLEVEKHTYETVPPEERQYPKGHALHWCGSIRSVKQERVKVPYHGYIVFYHYKDNTAYDFKAKFTDGKLVEITKI